jgi:hypothetical protein
MENAIDGGRMSALSRRGNDGNDGLGDFADLFALRDMGINSE